MTLADSEVAATVAVKDMAVAKEFYGTVLGLKLQKESPAGATYGSGASTLFVYPSQFAGTNKATYAGWHVDDVAAEVEGLKSKGVNFQQFDLPGATWEGDVAVMGALRGAWFTDPDGNILALDNGQE